MRDIKIIRLDWEQILTLLQAPQTLIAITIGWGIFLYFYGLSITGPFIFGDESTYFSFARTIARGENIASFNQYGPLYPALIAPLFFFKNIFTTYQAIRIFNILILISATIPAYLLAKQLFTNPWLRTFLPYCLLITPFSGFVYLIWAEPLYLPLFYWTCFLFYLHTKKQTLIRSVLLSMLLASLYYTKPGAGLVVQIAAFITLAAHAFIKQKLQTRNMKQFVSLTILICLLFDLPWILHYIHMGLSIIGYAGATQDLSWRITHQGYLPLAFAIIRSFFYQFSYFFIGTWGTIGIMMALFATQWRNLNIIERNFILFIILCSLGLMALSAIGMASYTVLDYKMPNGRYFSLLLPLITFLALHLLFEKKVENKHSITLLLITLFVTAIIAFIASPLYTRSPNAYVSMPELSPIIYISDAGRIIWRHTVEQPHFWLRINVVLFFAVFALGILLLRKQRYTSNVAAAVIFIGALFSTWAEQHYIIIIGSSQSGFNNVYRYFKENNIDIALVRFDKKFEVGNAQFLTPFWMEAPSIYLEASQAMKRSNAHKCSYFVSQDKLALRKLFSSHGYTVYMPGVKNKTI